MAATHAQRSKRPLPLFEGILPIDSARIPTDVIAGATLAALAIPEVMGYAKIAGMPVVTGLYTIILPVLLSRSSGRPATSWSARIRRPPRSWRRACRPWGPSAGSTEYIALAGLAALMCGVVLLLARAAPPRLHRQLPVAQRPHRLPHRRRASRSRWASSRAIFGVPEPVGTTLEKFVDTLQAIPTDTSCATLAVSVASSVIILGLGAWSTRRSRARCIAVVGSILASYRASTSRPVASRCSAPSRAACRRSACRPSVIDHDNIVALLPTVVSLLHRDPRPERGHVARLRGEVRRQLRRERRPRRALGRPTSAPGISGTFLVNGSPTKTEMVDGAGGKTQIAQLTAAAIVARRPALPDRPAVLYAERGPGGGRLPHRHPAHRLSRAWPTSPASATGEFAVAALTAATVVIVGVEQGIILAIVALDHRAHLSQLSPVRHALAVDADGRLESARCRDGKAPEARPGLVDLPVRSEPVLRQRDTLHRGGHRISSRPPTRRCAGSASSGSAMGDVDYSGADCDPSRSREELERKSVTFVAGRRRARRVRGQLDAYGLTETDRRSTTSTPSIRDATTRHTSDAEPAGGDAGRPVTATCRRTVDAR